MILTQLILGSRIGTGVACSLHNRVEKHSFRYAKRYIYKTTELATDIKPRPYIVKKPKNEVQIIVIGAGLAGLSAASHLIRNGFERTLVLEATERYGGRVNSKQFGDAFCELGAKWIAMDASKDSAYAVLSEASGLQKKLRQTGELIYLTTMGTKINKKTPETVNLLFHKLCSRLKVNERYRAGNMHEFNSLHSYFHSETSTLVEHTFKKEEQIIATDIFSSLFKEFGSLLGCCLEYVNIEHLTQLPKANKNPIYIPTGLDNLLTLIMDNFNTDHIKIGKPVGEIKWHGLLKAGGGVSVGCLDGSTFRADHIICTLPLGVLKNFAQHMFKPMLPKEKLSAIKNIGFGNPVKIYFEYKEDIQSWFKTNIRPLWSAEERSKDLKWTKQVVEISKLPSSCRVLEILVGGAFYDKIEKLPDVEVLNEITKLLRNCLNNSSIPYPDSLLRSNWSSCACYLGGRPYFSTDSTISDVNTLAMPLGWESLLFAGDATILPGFGTIDGARKSGIREAQRLVAYYKK